MSSLRYVIAEPHHTTGIVQVHQASFQGFFLTFLGRRFLKVFYGELIGDPQCVVIVGLADDGQVIAFGTATENQVGLYSRLLRRRVLSFALASLGALIRKPTIFPRLWRALLYPQRKREAATIACYLSAGVLPETSGQGIGKLISSAVLHCMKQRGITEISLTTDRDNNDHTNRFHQKTGFQLYRQFVTEEGRWMNEYILNLAEWQPPAELMPQLPCYHQPEAAEINS